MNHVTELLNRNRPAFKVLIIKTFTVKKMEYFIIANGNIMVFKCIPEIDCF